MKSENTAREQTVDLIEIWQRIEGSYIKHREAIIGLGVINHLNIEILAVAQFGHWCLERWLFGHGHGQS